MAVFGMDVQGAFPEPRRIEGGGKKRFVRIVNGTDGAMMRLGSAGSELFISGNMTISTDVYGGLGRPSMPELNSAEFSIDYFVPKNGRNSGPNNSARRLASATLRSHVLDNWL